MNKILVIDDDDVTRQFVEYVLEGAGYRVSTAADGATGLALAEREQPGVIVSDIMMDGCDGYTILSRLRQHPATASTPVILISAAASTQGFRQGMALGADDYLQKPFSATALLEAVAAQQRKQAVVRRNAEASLNALRNSLSLALPHELNTPLNGIMGCAQILKSDAESLTPAEVAAFGDDLVVSSERLYRVIVNYLAYVQLEMAALDPAAVEALRRHREADGAPAVESVARQVAGQLERSNDLRLDVRSPAPVAMAPSHLTKIATELVHNAFRFSAVGTEVWVRVGGSTEGSVLVIEDRGRGMTPDQIRRIGAYAQFDRDIHAHEGLGLGLAIARRTAELHGGSLEVESEPGQGTKVTVRLP
jgi:signal transduction histidine kinase